MEFNERLHRQVNCYQYQVRLREELVNLRGPVRSVKAPEATIRGGEGRQELRCLYFYSPCGEQNTAKLIKILTEGSLHMSPETGMARLSGRSLSLVHMGNFGSATNMNKAPSFKLHPGSRAGVFIWENF